MLLHSNSYHRPIISDAASLLFNIHKHNSSFIQSQILVDFYHSLGDAFSRMKSLPLPTLTQTLPSVLGYIQTCTKDSVSRQFAYQVKHQLRISSVRSNSSIQISFDNFPTPCWFFFLFHHSKTHGSQHPSYPTISLDSNISDFFWPTDPTALPLATTLTISLPIPFLRLSQRLHASFFPWLSLFLLLSLSLPQFTTNHFWNNFRTHFWAYLFSSPLCHFNRPLSSMLPASPFSYSNCTSPFRLKSSNLFSLIFTLNPLPLWFLLLFVVVYTSKAFSMTWIFVTQTLTPLLMSDVCIPISQFDNYQLILFELAPLRSNFQFDNNIFLPIKGLPWAENILLLLPTFHALMGTRSS